MRQVTFREVMAMGNKEAIPAIAGTIVAAYERRTGESQYGPWSLQAALISDGMDEIRLKLNNLPDWNDVIGTSVLVQCKDTKKGLFGVRKLVEEYNGQTYHKVEIRNGAVIKFGDMQQPAPKSGPQGNHQSAGVTPSNPSSPDIDGFQSSLTQAMNAYDMCCDAALVLQDKHKLSAEHYQAAVASLFIYADKKGLINLMPTTPLGRSSDASKDAEPSNDWF